MGCNCGAKRAAPESFVHTAADGKVTAYRTKSEAEAAVLRRGGTWKKQ